MSNLEMEQFTVTESEVYAAETTSQELLCYMDGDPMELLEPQDHFAILAWEQEQPYSHNIFNCLSPMY